MAVAASGAALQLKKAGKVAALLLALALASCRATPEEQPPDMTAPPDLYSAPVGPADMTADAGADMFVCPSGAEVCDDQCDNDGNGYVDADDPACTRQLLVTFTMPGVVPTGSPALWRLVLDDSPHVLVVDPRAVAPGAMANYNKAFGAAVYMVNDESDELDTIVLGLPPIPLAPTFHTRDVCTFNGELIVLEPNSAPMKSTLHRFKPDGITELAPSVTMSGIASACASDGVNLYVAYYELVTPSRIEVFTKGSASSGPVDSGSSLAIPAAVASCCDRLLDFAYVKKGGGFVGLFADGMAGTLGDAQLTSALMAPFALDGGVGPAIDAGSWHGAGEFLP